ncbi:MAG: type II toxin-antitoxin system VapC family toxin [Pikeienuella sp.]|uniref:type II toxin-antitoxin system VapC family toxin n=1 Tax=Pikeienuella sp. TaxID=2831957 RepID=UPI00391D2E67
MLDCSAVLALIFDEPGRERVDAALPEALLSAVNLAEVVSKLIERGVAKADVPPLISPFLAGIVPFDKAMALEAGALRAETRAAGLSLGDRACLALAAAEGVPALTADRAWAQVDIGVEIEVIR